MSFKCESFWDTHKADLLEHDHVHFFEFHIDELHDKGLLSRWNLRDLESTIKVSYFLLSDFSYKVYAFESFRKIERSGKRRKSRRRRKTMKWRRSKSWRSQTLKKKIFKRRKNENNSCEKWSWTHWNKNRNRSILKLCLLKLKLKQISLAYIWVWEYFHNSS